MKLFPYEWRLGLKRVSGRIRIRECGKGGGEDVRQYPVCGLFGSKVRLHFGTYIAALHAFEAID
jgi:hypothetical protein